MSAVAQPAFAQAVLVWARIALLSFGGPAGQIALMHRELVDERRWLSEPQFLHALNFCMLLPGPEAQQLATYIGWLKHGIRGGIAAGTLFILPGAVAILLLSLAYATLGDTPALQALFFGLKAAVLAIVVDAVVRIGRRAIRSGAAMAITAAAFIAIFFFAVPFPLIIASAALIGLLGARLASSAATHGGPVEPVLVEARRNTRLAAVAFLLLWLVPVALLLVILGRGNVFTEIALFFSRMAVVTFGGAYAVLAYVAQQAVGEYGWLSAEAMLDGLGMAETTPGPLIMVTQFVGFMAAAGQATGLPPLLAGILGGLLTTWVTFTPCFLWIFAGAPYVERLRGNLRLARALAAITAAVVGVILNLAIWFSIHFLFAEVRTVESGPFRFDSPILSSVDPLAAALSLAAMVAVFRFRAGAVSALLGCAIASLIARLLL
ncbi:MAG TPA: chromate efflux transporter [Sphingomicrobium sp.]|nr:chromate efflux transporter [Sphingomicrobium sp.]